MDQNLWGNFSELLMIFLLLLYLLMKLMLLVQKGNLNLNFNSHEDRVGVEEWCIV